MGGGSETTDYPETFIRLRTFEVMYVRDTLSGHPAVPDGPTIGDQVTAFYDENDAWPIAHSLEISAPETDSSMRERVKHVMVLSWIPREAYVEMQAAILARSQEILAQGPLRREDENDSDTG